MVDEESETEIEQRLVEVGGAKLEVFLDPSGRRQTPIIGAAHPAGVYGPSAVALIERTAGVSAVCINPRGIGASSAPAERRYSLDDMVDDIETVRRRLGIGPWVFWGMSGGGWLGMVYARNYPDSLSGLILESICPCFRARLADPSCVLSPFHPSWRPMLAERGLIAAESHDTPGNPWQTEWLKVEGVGSVFRRRNGPALLVSAAPVTPEMHAAMPLLWTVDTRDWLGAIRTPTLVLSGTADPIVPLSHARDVHRGIVGSDFVAIEGGGHVPTTEGRPEVAAAVREFLHTHVH